MLSSTTVRAAVQGSDSVGPFAFPFKIFAASDLDVRKTSALGVVTPLAYPTDYTVAGVGDAAGGTLTLSVALATGETLSIVRATPYNQPTSLRALGTFFPGTHEDALDRLTMLVQQHDDALKRSAHLASSVDPATITMELPTPATGQVLGWASPTQLSTFTLDSSAVGVPGGGRTVPTLTAFLANNVTFNPKDFGALGNGVADDRGSFVIAQAATATTAALAIAPGTFRIASNLTISSDIAPAVGAVLKPDSGVVVTVTGLVLAGHHKWIDTSAGGSVVVQPKSMTVLKPAWWGLVADYDLSVGGSNGTDNAAALQAMAASITPPSVAHGYRIQFPSGAARFTAGAVFTGSGVFLEGAHREATQLIFDPPADGATLITFQRSGALEFFGGGIRQMRIGSTSTNDRQKTAVHLIDISEFLIEDFAINRLSSDTDANAYPNPAVRRQTNPSVGLHVQGREFLRLNRFTSFADRPIWIDNNPNYPGAPGAPTSIDLRIDCDTFHFSDLYLGTQAETEAGIVFYGAAVSGTLLPSGTQYGLNLQNFVLDGSNSFVGPGLSAIRYIVTAGQSWHANRSVLISNVRHEGTATDAGTLIDIELDNATLQGLIIRNVQPALNNAVKLRGCYDVTIEEFSYSSPAANARNVFDFDGTCNYIRGKNVSVAVSANNLMSFGTLRKAYAFGDTTNYAIERDFMLVQSAQIAHPHVIGNDPDNGSACYEVENSSGQRFRLVAGIPGASNNGLTLRDMTNNKNAWHYVNGVLVLDQTTSALGPFILAPPNVPVYGAAITINGTLSNTFDLTATNGTAFTIGAPLSPAAGQEITITIRNTSGGALGAVTWNAVYKLAAWTSPATGFSRSIVFFYDGANWVEKSRTPADVPN